MKILPFPHSLWLHSFHSNYASLLSVLSLLVYIPHVLAEEDIVQCYTRFQTVPMLTGQPTCIPPGWMTSLLIQQCLQLLDSQWSITFLGRKSLSLTLFRLTDIYNLYQFLSMLKIVLFYKSIIFGLTLHRGLATPIQFLWIVIYI